MTEAIKIAAIGTVCVMLYLLVRQVRPELAPLVQISGIIVVAAMVFNDLKSLFENATGMLNEFNVLDSAYLEVIIKVLGIAIITKIGSDICSDSGNSALASNVELAGKVIMLLMCFPLIRTVAELAGGLLK